jgi:hypothetical protein
MIRCPLADAMRAHGVVSRIFGSDRLLGLTALIPVVSLAESVEAFQELECRLI